MKTLLAIVLAVLCFSAAAEQLYRWVDAEGNVHYSDRPPPDSATESEEIVVDAEIPPERQAAAQRRLDEQQRQLEAGRSRRDERQQDSAQQAAQRQQQEAARQRLCAEARTNMTRLVEVGPVFRVNQSGEREYLDDSQRQAEIARYRQVVNQACQ